MNDAAALELFHSAPVPRAVLKNALPAMGAMLMVLIYQLADTFFIAQTHNDILVAAVSLTTPVFLIFMAVGTVFGIGGTSVISRALGEGRTDYAKRVCAFCMWSCVILGVVLGGAYLIFMDPLLTLMGASTDTWAPPGPTSSPPRWWCCFISAPSAPWSEPNNKQEKRHPYGCLFSLEKFAQDQDEVHRSAVTSQVQPLLGSCLSSSSRMESALRPQTLSGCPSVTDSEVNSFVLIPYSPFLQPAQ